MIDPAAHLRSPRRRRLRRDESGAALVEFAFVFVLFVFVLYGLITFGMILAQKQSITNAAADGARAAVGQASPEDVAQERVREALGEPDGGRYVDTYVVAPCVGGSGNCITVEIKYDYDGHPLVPEAPGLGLATPDEFGAKAVVQVS